MKNSLFGTDGIRGLSGKSPLTFQEVFSIGHYAGRVLKHKFPDQPVRIIGVRDTRASGRDLFRYLADGLRSNGIDVYDAGVLSTPSIACLVHAHRFHSGFVVSASHNPPQFNGIKFFNSHGRKWADEWEKEVEGHFQHGKASPIKGPMGHLIDASDFSTDYEDFLIKTLDQAPKPASPVFSGIRIALDCSNGANSIVGPDVFRRLGAEVYVIGNNPNGHNINVRCGSQDLRALRSLVLRHKCSAGIAFDGDGDRVIMLDEHGGVVDGDHILVILSKWLKQNRQLRGNLLVVTVMANLGLKQILKKNGIHLLETPVGDRHVSESMRLHGAVLGGEQSGHIILGRYLPSGDGLLTALHIVMIMVKSDKALSSLAAEMKKFPQVLVNLHVKNKVPLERLPKVRREISDVEHALGNSGRVLVRYSGTEPLLRIMLEGPDKSVIERYARNIAQVAKTSLN